MDRFVRALAGVVGRSCAAREGVAARDLFDEQPWPKPAARARAAAIYLMRVELNLSVEDVAKLYCAGDRRAVSRANRRIEDARETDQALDNWLSEMERALKGQTV